MSWVADKAGSFLGKLTGADDVADASKKAANTQAAAANRALDLLRSDLAPYREAGEKGIGLLSFLTDQNAQADFLKNNPLFQMSLDSMNKATMANQAARGKLGSGSTLSALQNNAMVAGLPLLDRYTNNIMNTVNLGQNSAAQSASGSSNLMTQAANAQAAGIMGAANAQAQSKGQLFGMLGGAGMGAMLGGAGMMGGMGAAGGAGAGALMALSDERAKEEVNKVGELKNGLGVYTYKYKGDNKTQMGVMAQEAQKKRPDAVRSINGLLHVDYSKVAR